MFLCIDWGNSSLKAGWFEDGQLRETGQFSQLAEFEAKCRQKLPEAVIISSTNRPGDQLCERLALPLGTFWLTLNGNTPVPIRKDYDTPQTLGTDRVGAAVGAIVLFPGDSCLVIDMGTCITYDFIDAKAIFRGGMISPGFHMRFRAMHEFTKRLPLVKPDEARPPLLAKNTNQAMQAGVVNGLVAELNGLIKAHRKESSSVKVILCGGDAPFFEDRLKPPVYAIPDLVLIGLNRILEYNLPSTGESRLKN